MKDKFMINIHLIITTNEEDKKMSIIQALLLGLEQGLTGFFPVSSSGHPGIDRKNRFNFSSEKGLLFEVLPFSGYFNCISPGFKKAFLGKVVVVYHLWDNIRTYFHNSNHYTEKHSKK